MAQEPSLSELYSYRPNAELAQGDRNIVPDDRQAIQALLQGAKDNILIQQNRYNQFQKSLQDNFDKFKFDYDGIAPQHREELQKDAVIFYKDLMSDPSVLANPLKNPQAYAKLMEDFQKLNSKIAKSKSINKYTTAHEKYMNENPDLLNEDNKKRIQQSLSVPIDQWQAFDLKLPSAIDYSTLSAAGIKESMKDRLIDEPVMSYKIDEKGNKIIMMENGKPKLDAQGNQIYEQYYTGTRRRGVLKKADQQTYENYGEALFESNKPINKYGVTLKQAVSDTFNALPENQRNDIIEAAKEKKQDPLKLFFNTTWKSFYRDMDDLSGIKEVKDEAFLENLQFNNKMALELLKQKGDKNLESYKYSLGQKSEKEQAKSLLQFLGSTLKDAIINGDKKTVKQQDGTKEDVVVLGLPQQALTLFGAGSTIKTIEGDEVTLTDKDKPDHIEYNPKNKTYTIVVYEKNQDGKISRENGWNIRKKQIRIGEDQFAATLGTVLLSKDKLPKAYQYMKEELGEMSLGDYINVKTNQTNQTNSKKSKNITISETGKWGYDEQGNFIKLKQ